MVSGGAKITITMVEIQRAENSFQYSAYFEKSEKLLIKILEIH